jgi:hypothetical protein
MPTCTLPVVKGVVEPPGSGGGVADVEAGFLSAVALAIEDQFVGGGLGPVDRGSGEKGVRHAADPLDGVPVRPDDGGGGPMALDDELVGSAVSSGSRPGERSRRGPKDPGAPGAATGRSVATTDRRRPG